MHQIDNLEVYTEKMKKSFLDKIFFMDKFFDDVSTIVDFGCANGELIRVLKYLFPEHRYIGYDINPDMISLAKKLVPDCSFYANWDNIPTQKNTSLINISSTIHEVYSYSSASDIETFWERIFGSGFKYVAIRDMMVSKSTEKPVNLKQLACVKSKKLAMLKSFESVRGDITTQKELIHFLLKYDYTENWTREVREDYLPITMEELLAMIPPEYEIVYSEHYTLPYVKQKIQKDFEINLEDATHFKIFLKRRD